MSADQMMLSLQKDEPRVYPIVAKDGVELPVKIEISYYAASLYKVTVRHDDGESYYAVLNSETTQDKGRLNTIIDSVTKQDVDGLIKAIRGNDMGTQADMANIILRALERTPIEKKTPISTHHSSPCCLPPSSHPSGYASSTMMVQPTPVWRPRQPQWGSSFTSIRVIYSGKSNSPVYSGLSVQGSSVQEEQTNAHAALPKFL